MSAAAITGDVCYHPHHDIVLVKQSMLGSARRKVLIVDHSKFERRALHAIASVRDFDLIIVDSNVDASDLQALKQTGVDIRLAEVAPPTAG